jgi:hypothetical protein
MDPTPWMELAHAGAAALVGAMATDIWATVRNTAARLVGGRDDRDASALAWLEQNRQGLEQQPDGCRDGAAAVLRGQLAGLLLTRLNDNPGLASSVERIIAAVGQPESVTTISQRATATFGGRVYQAGRDVTMRDRQH